MTSIYLWRGHHGPEFRALFDRAWDEGSLLIVCPPTVIDPSFVDALPEGRVELVGDWTDFAPPARSFPPPCYPDVPVLGVFTTGTTGHGRSAQKLVLYSRANIVASQEAIFALYDADRIETIFCYPQPYHVFGLLLGYALARLKKLKLVCPAGPYGRAAHAQWLAEDTTSMLTLATPSHILDLCSYLTEHGHTPRPTYTCILGGARVEVATWRKARDVARIESPSIGYGCTEASPGITHLPPGVEPLVDGDIGWPLPHVTLDFEGADGEGYTMRGPSVCLAAIEGGVATFPSVHTVRDALHSLDVEHAGRMGRLAFVHRTDMVLNRGGEKFPLERIEAVLKTRLGVEAICVAVPDARLGWELGIVARATPEVASDAVFATLADVFKRRFNPTLLRRVTELPLNASAKPDRKVAASLLVAAADAI